MIDPYSDPRFGLRGRRPGRVEPEYTYQDAYGPAPQQAAGRTGAAALGFQGRIPQQGGAYDPYAMPDYQTRQPQAVGQFDYENGRIVGSTDFYGNRFDTRGLPLGPEQARATQQLQGPGGPQAPEYQYGGEAQAPRWGVAGQPDVYSTAGPVGYQAPPAAPGGPQQAYGATGRYLSPQNLQRAQALGYDPVVFQQLVDQGMDPADVERAAMTIGARAAVAGYSGVDPRTGAPTLAMQQYQTQTLGEAYRGDQRYQQALASAAQQRMAAESAAVRAQGDVGQQLFQKNLPIGRPPNTADIAAAQAAARADPTYWQQMNQAATAARGGVTQGTQRAAGVLDRQGLSFSQALEQVYGGNQYRYGA